MTSLTKMNNVPKKQLAEKKKTILLHFMPTMCHKQSGAEYVSLVSKFIGFD